MKKQTKKNKGFTLIELLTVITIIGILFGLAFKAGDVAMMMAAKAEATNNMRQILNAYIAYEGDKGSITETIDDVEMVDDSGEEPNYGDGTNHDWAAVLAKEQASMNDAMIYKLKRDKFAKKENKKHDAKFILDPEDEEKTQIDEKFEESILCFNMFAGLQESDDFGRGKTPVLYTAGLNEEGKWDKDAPHGTSGGHIGYLDGGVKPYKKLKEDEFKRYDEPTQDTQRLDEAIYGVPLSHRGKDEFTGDRD